MRKIEVENSRVLMQEKSSLVIREVDLIEKAPKESKSRYVIEESTWSTKASYEPNSSDPIGDSSTTFS